MNKHPVGDRDIPEEDLKPNKKLGLKKLKEKKDK